MSTPVIEARDRGHPGPDRSLEEKVARLQLAVADEPSRGGRRMIILKDREKS
jgi:hypothetical protein